MKAQLRPTTPDEINQRTQNTMIEHLGIVFTEVGKDYLKAQMPVDHRTHQPAGILHGGASVALAETIGSIGAGLAMNNEKIQCVGLEINANHIRACTDGVVEGIGKPLHFGKTTQVWEITLTQEQSLICISRITLMNLRKESTP